MSTNSIPETIRKRKRETWCPERQTKDNDCTGEATKVSIADHSIQLAAKDHKIQCLNAVIDSNESKIEELYNQLRVAMTAIQERDQKVNELTANIEEIQQKYEIEMGARYFIRTSSFAVIDLLTLVLNVKPNCVKIFRILKIRS